MSPAFITSVRVDHKPGAPHSYVTVYIRGANCGTLCVREEEAEPLRALLTGDREKLTPWMRGALDAITSVVPPVRPGLSEWCSQAQVPPGTDPRYAIEPPPLHMHPQPECGEDCAHCAEMARLREQSRITPEQRASLKRIRDGLTASARRDEERLEQRAEEFIRQVEAGGPVLTTVSTAEGREFHVDPSLDLDAMNRGRAAVGMPPLRVRLSNSVPGIGDAGDVIDFIPRDVKP